MVIEGAGETKGNNAYFQSTLQESKIHGNTTWEMGTDQMCGYSEVTERPPLSWATDKDSPAEKLSQLLGEKDKEWTATVEKQRPLRLLDLPVDVLKEIIKEVTHTNDLTSLALTHSALHHLAIPCIYSRFDIVWPETQMTSEPRTGVDALTYGLSTLVMSQDTAGTTATCPYYSCSHCGKENRMPTDELPQEVHGYHSRRRKGNNFARYVKKFSLGNGPVDWVQEYLISKESGKMLGTLVALAIARMPNLETFIWDMPTGVLRDVWLALGSLGDRYDDDRPRLERIWIRWHDNKNVAPTTASQPAGASVHPLPLGVPPHSLALSTGGVPTDGSSDQTLLSRSYRSVEHPNFSILPPLRSITVLDIDELAYLEELSVLIERSANCLRELRIGAASSALAKRWSGSAQHATAVPSAPDPSIAYAAAGGMLGMIMSKLYDCRIHTTSMDDVAQEIEISQKQPDAELVAETVPPIQVESNQPEAQDGNPTNLTLTSIAHTQDKLLGESTVTLPFAIPLLSAVATPILGLPEQRLSNAKDSTPLDIDSFDNLSSTTASQALAATTLPLRPAKSSNVNHHGQPSSPSSTPIAGSCKSCTAPIATALPMSKQRKLKLETFALESMPIYVSVLQKTIDWTVLTSLTLLNCESDEELWKALRRTYAPKSIQTSTSISTHSTLRRTSQSHARTLSSTSSSDYPLRLKKIHTNHVSPSLIAFLKDALAPNSLEWMFLQDRTVLAPKVSIESIYRGPLRRHRGSLKKVLIDSRDRHEESPSRNQKWKKWMFTREVLTFITSGKMTCLRELAMAIDYKDWHFFLQRLPQIPHLRSLYVPYIADHVHGHHFDARELALQVVDIVTLRPEVEICYMGISTKCFEILENKNGDDPITSFHDSGTTSANAGPGGVTVGDPDDDSDTDDEDHDDDDEDDNADQAAAAGVADNHEADDSDAADDSDGASEDEGPENEDGKKVRLKLREILFYDDKVSIFNARHAQL